MSELLRMRRKFFDTYGSRPQEQEADLPPRGVRFSCPCCGYPTLGGRGYYEICQLCDWEDDGQDAADSDQVRGGPNGRYSLTEAQRNFEDYLVMYSPAEDMRLGGPNSEAVKQIKRQLKAAFEAMMKEPSPTCLNDLWREVQDCETALLVETQRSMVQYDQETGNG